MALGCTVCLSLIWLFCLVSLYIWNLSIVFIFLPLEMKYIGVMIVSMGPNEWWCFKRCSVKFDLYWPSV
jgi:hypothetical protein